MKKAFIAGVALLMALPVFSQSFSKGDMVVDLSIGVGAAKVVSNEYNSKNELFSEEKSNATFTQRLGFEVGVIDISDKSAIGFGVNINNSYGASHSSFVAGSYDYTYTLNRYRKEKDNMGRNRWTMYQSTVEDRKGSGTAQAKACIEDFNVMFKLAYHHQFVDYLDTYFALGFGVSSYRELYSDFTKESGFSKSEKSFDSDYSGTYQLTYKYDDLEHVDWQGSAPGGRFVVAAYLGARYYVTDNIGINAQIGLTSLSFKKDLNNYSVFDMGVSYKF